jgi:hypothetical protein
MPTILKSWSINLLEPSGAVQDCNGIALKFHLKNGTILGDKTIIDQKMCVLIFSTNFV